MPKVKDASSDDVLEFTKSLFKEAKVAVPDNVLGHAHRIGYTDRIINKNAKASL